MKKLVFRLPLFLSFHQLFPKIRKGVGSKALHTFDSMVIVVDYSKEKDLQATPFWPIMLAHARVHSSNLWVVIHHAQLTIPTVLPANIIPQVAITSKLTSRIFRNKSTQKIVKKHNASFLITINSVKKYPLKKYITIAASSTTGLGRSTILFFSEHVHQQAVQQKMLIENAAILWPSIPQVNATESHINTKQHLTEGTEFFYSIETPVEHNSLINLLKAFSSFKKLQLSNWKLVLDLDINTLPAATRQAIDTYKYKEHVLYIPHSQVQLVQAAYAVIIMKEDYGYATCTALALAASCAIIAPAHSMVEELAGSAALYFEADTPMHMATCLMQLYKDEQQRGALRQMACKQAEEFTIEKGVTQLEGIINSLTLNA